jgi:transcriptional regulator with XRE-family HTH domain
MNRRQFRQESPVNFGEKVKQLRAERNLTQPQLAQAIGIEQSYLSKLENDKSVPSADTFQAILRALDVDVATFLQGVDDKVVHRDLKQIPDVANHVNAVVSLKIHDIKRWLFGSAVACVLGLTLGVAAHRGLLFPNTQYNYSSNGVVLPGEPTNVFETYQKQMHHRYARGQITAKEHASLIDEFSRRHDEHVQLLDVYRGETFTQQVEGGQRVYTMTRIMETDRRENRWMMFAGALLAFGGVLGFVVEQRLRSVTL